MKPPSAIHLFETTSEKIDFLREFKKEATAEEYLCALGEPIKGIGVNYNVGAFAGVPPNAEQIDQP
ncbi:hypothetical protein [Persicobacter psychrovividus]|uniref:Uncharacterized protein n=1 Tax=Persicobacter psychrovividus TaxID=387638 RepID=A0ABM7VN96_9BACT|nr:hypothetical protein PEPS_47530 [Persicobacter psychrovividus]